MGDPIRWDTIMSRPDSGAVQGIASAGQLINNGVGQLQQTLKDNQNIQDQNFANHTKLNTNAFLDAVAKYQNPDELKAAMQQGGALDQLRSSLGPNIDANAVRGAADARVKQTMQQAQDNILYNHAMTDEKTAPLVQQFQTARMRGDKAGMDAAMTAYTAQNGRDPTSLLKFADMRDWEINQRGMQLQTSNDQHNTSVDNIRHNQEMEGIQRISANASAAQAAAAQQQANTSGKLATYQIEAGTQDRQTAKAAGMATALKNSLSANGNVYADGIYTGNNAGELTDFMRKNGIGDGNPDKEAYVIKRLEELRQKGIEVKGPNGGRMLDSAGKPIIIHDIPLAAVRSAISGASADGFSRVFTWNTAAANSVEENLKSILGTATKDGKGNLVSKAVDDLRLYTEATDRLNQNAPAIAPSRAPGNPYSPPKHK